MERVSDIVWPIAEKRMSASLIMHFQADVEKETEEKQKTLTTTNVTVKHTVVHA